MRYKIIKKTKSRVLKKILRLRDYKSRKNQLFYSFQKILKVRNAILYEAEKNIMKLFDVRIRSRNCQIGSRNTKRIKRRRSE